jgi:hypothetical protein
MHEKCYVTPAISNKCTENQIRNYNHAEHAQQKSSAKSTVNNKTSTLTRIPLLAENLMMQRKEDSVMIMKAPFQIYY